MKLTPEQQARFWSRIDRRGADQCWPWVGATNQGGYGVVYLDGKRYQATRIAVLLTTGKTPACDKDVCHSCDNPNCTNPNHLSECTRKQNMQDASKRGRIRSQKQKLTPDKVWAIRDDPRKQKVIADEYGVDHSIVYKIKRRIIWKYI